MINTSSSDSLVIYYQYTYFITNNNFKSTHKKYKNGGRR